MLSLFFYVPCKKLTKKNGKNVQNQSSYGSALGTALTDWRSDMCHFLTDFWRLSWSILRQDSLNAFKGVKKCNFIAKGIVTKNTNSLLPKPKKTLKNTFFDQNNKFIINIFVFLRGWCLYICQNFNFRGVIHFFARLKGAK